MQYKTFENFNNKKKHQAKVIAAFPGTGKSTYYKQHATEQIILDSDSSLFDKKDFPNNYIQHIKNHLNKADIIFVSSHKIVRDALVEANIPFTLIYPNLDCKDEYLTRYQNRGNTTDFIKLLTQNYDAWVKDCMAQEGCKLIELKCGQFIADVIS